MKSRSMLIATVVGLLVSVPLLALPKTMLLCLPGFPGTSEQAQPYVDRMLRFLEGQIGAEKESISGMYLPNGEGAKAALTAKTPELALVGPSVYAENRKAMKMKVVARVEANGRGEETYHVITRVDGPADLSALSGGTVSGTVLHDSKYVYNVILDGKLKAGSLTLATASRPLKALRDVASGKITAAIVDSYTKDSMKELDFAADVRVIYSSKPVPPPAVVVMGAGISSAEQIKKALVGLCLRPEGAELCKSLTISSIKVASDADYHDLVKRYER